MLLGHIVGGNILYQLPVWLYPVALLIAFTLQVLGLLRVMPLWFTSLSLFLIIFFSLHQFKRQKKSRKFW